MERPVCCHRSFGYPLESSISAAIGVSDGFRTTPNDQSDQANQQLTSANCSKSEQIVRESATSRNQTSEGDEAAPNEERKS